MKKYAALALGMIFAFSLTAQNGLKGPQAKNYKPWKDDSPAKPVYVVMKADMKGPEAKNTQTWEAKETSRLLVKTEVKTDAVTGPKAKNSKPWN